MTLASPRVPRFSLVHLLPVGELVCLYAHTGMPMLHLVLSVSAVKPISPMTPKLLRTGFGSSFSSMESHISGSRHACGPVKQLCGQMFCRSTDCIPFSQFSHLDRVTTCDTCVCVVCVLTCVCVGVWARARVPD